jgi:hypothetical protein
MPGAAVGLAAAAGGKAMETGELLPMTETAKPRWEEWAVLYGSSPLTLKRWAAHGRDRADDCPLEVAAEMPGWWSRNMAQRIPHKVLLAAQSAGWKPGHAVAVAAAPVVIPGDLAEPLKFEEARADEMGIEATLKRLEDMEIFANRTYKEAIAVGDQNKALIAERSFRQLAAEKVKVEEKVRAARLAARDLIPRQEAEARIAEVHGDLILRFRGLGDRVCRSFGQPVTAESEAKWLDLVDEFCIALREEVLA